jgi:hypothetical protein
MMSHHQSLRFLLIVLIFNSINVGTASSALQRRHHIFLEDDGSGKGILN